MKNVIIIALALSMILVANAHSQSSTAFRAISLMTGQAVNFKLIHPRQCAFGDMDAVFSELRNSDRPSLLFSLEPLDAKAVNKGIIIELLSNASNKNRKPDGYNIPVKIPAVMEPQLWGVFICKDSGNTGSCQNKPAEDVNLVLSRYNAERVKFPLKERASDKVYFFKPVIITATQLIYPQEKFSDAGYQELKVLLQKNKAYSAASVDYVKRTGAILKSLPFESSGNDLLIRMPIYDSQHCS